MPFEDRRDAGVRLARSLADLRDERPVVLALPRGGVPVGAEVARLLGAPLDVLVVRKLGCPGQPELGFGAVGEDGVRVFNDDVIARARVGPDDVRRVSEQERAELARRVRRYRQGRARVPVADRTVVLVDDGLATGSTARAAIEVLRQLGAGRVVLAVPVAPSDTVAELAAVADEVVCLETPAWFVAVGAFYHDFRQIGDDEVTALLAEAAGAAGRADAADTERRTPG